MHSQKSFSFLLLIFISCYFNINANAQRVVFISNYSGYCYDGMYYLDEDVKLFRDVFGNEDDGGWQRFTFDEIDSANEFLDNTCLLFLDGFCDYYEFTEFYEIYTTEIEEFVAGGGNLYMNIALPDPVYLSLGFDSLKIIPYGSAYALIVDTLHSITYAPNLISFAYPITARPGSGPLLSVGSFTGNAIDTILYDTIINTSSGDTFPQRAPLIYFEWGEGKVIASTFAIWHWDELLSNYKNLRRNILYYLSGCMHGPVDAGAFAIAAPLVNCQLTEEETLQVLLYNYGTDTLTEITVCFSVDGGAEVCENFEFAIPPQHSDTAMFSATANFSGCGVHSITAYTITQGDTITDNDTLVMQIESLCPPLSSAGLPDTICINAGLIQASPEQGGGLWNGTGITNSATGSFDPMIVGEDFTSEISYTYEMSFNYQFSEIEYAEPTMTEADSIPLADTDWEKIYLGFYFTYFNQTYDSVYVASNGYMSFGAPHDTWYPAIPDYSGAITNLVVLAGGDMNPAAYGRVRYSTEGTAPYRRFILHYDSVRCDYEAGKYIDVYGILYEENNSIDIVVNHLPGVEFWGISQGISNLEGTIGINTHNPERIPWLRDKWYDTDIEEVAYRFSPEQCFRTITDTILVTGDVAVNVLGNDTTFCPGGSLQIGTDYPGTEILWNTGETTPHINIEEAGIYTIQMHYGSGDCYLFDTITIASAEQDVFANVLGNDTLLCYGDTLQLEINYADTIFSFHWNTVDTTQIIIVSEAGNYALEIEYQSGCSLYDSIAINYNSPIFIESTSTPSPDDGPGGSITINVSGGTAPYTYLWSDGLIGTEIENVYPATYYLTVIDALGCSISTTVFVGIGTGIFDNENTQITIYPNPFDETIQVESEIAISKIEIINATAQYVFSTSYNTVENTIILNTNFLTQGIYILKTSMVNGESYTFLVNKI
ncbi:MAG: T9SS type A sorting domain-containing protein [Bacteroidetes bacterium]|nr:T9SS type A sorting domain-containing protein [Bacteroidota bacterium]